MIVSAGDFYKKLKEDEIHAIAEYVAIKCMGRVPSGPSVEGLAPDFREVSRMSVYLGNEEARLARIKYPAISPVLEEGQVGASGFDFRVGNFVAGSDILKARWSEEDIGKLECRVLKDGQEFVLQPDADGNKVYYLFSKESVNLPDNLELRVDSKSTTGRVGAICQEVGRFRDHIMWAVQSYAFPLLIRAGQTSLAQAAVRYSKSEYLDAKRVGELVSLFGDGLKMEEALGSDGVDMTFSARKAYVAKKTDKPVDMDARRTLDWREYFDLREYNGKFIQEAKKLHLLGTREGISLKNVCGFLSRHDRVHTGTGMWGHFAGIFQPGFSGKITMETYSHNNREITDGDRAGAVVFDLIEGDGKDLYSGNYQGQDVPMLPKMFRVD